MYLQPVRATSNTPFSHLGRRLKQYDFTLANEEEDFEIQDKELLFCSEHNRLPIRQRGSKPLTSRELQIIVKEAARKAGIKEWMNVVPHCLRKTFETVLRSHLTDGGRLEVKTQEYFMGHILAGSMDTYYDKTKIEELRKEYAKLLFKPQEKGNAEVLESLRNIAETMGVDYARLEESKKKEVGRALNDIEKLIIIQDAFKQAAKAFRNISDPNPRTMFTANGPGEKSLDKQDSSGKKQSTSEDEPHDFFWPKTSVSESVSITVSSSQRNKKTFIDANKSHKDEPSQFSLNVTRQERCTGPKQIHKKGRQSGTKGNSDLLQFLQHAG